MDNRFQCQSNLCSFQSESYKRLLRHTWDKHSVSAGFKYKCNISGCPKFYTNDRSFKRHLKSCHLWFYESHFKGNQNNSDSTTSFNENEWNEEEADCDENMNADEEDYFANNQDNFLEVELDCDDILSEFLLELREKFNVTNNCVCYISEKVSQILSYDRKRFSKQIQTSIQSNMNGDIDYETKAILQSESFFHESCLKFSGQKALTKFIRQKSSFVDVEEIALGFDSVTLKNECVQYVPILKTLEILLKHDDVFGSVYQANQPTHSTDGRLYSFKDGTAYKQNTFFSLNNQSLQIMLYHDDFNVVNPLGNKVTKHKVSAFYFVIGNLPSKHRSKLKDIHLALVCPAALIKKYGYEKILQPLLDDLLILEREGLRISVDNVPYCLKGTVTMMIADNLAAHAVGGFFCNFSTVHRYCRFCLALRSSINETKLTYEMRSKNNYDAHIDSILIDPTLKSVYGITQNSTLNTLNFFHVADGLPPDIAHDVFEGFGKDILRNIVIIFIKEDFFTLEELNNLILTFTYAEVDKANRPQIIKDSNSLNTLKIKQTACEMWSLLRLFPLLVGEMIPPGNKYWLNYILFLDILDRLCASSFNNAELNVLNALIQEFFSDYIELHPDKNLKPKAHFLCHYPSMIKKFGPLVKTLRFESKNGQMKSFLNNNKNKKNICQSLAKKHQMLMYLSYKNDFILEKKDLVAIGSSESTLENYPQSENNLISNKFVSSRNSTFIQARAVIDEGQRYSVGEAVVTGFSDDEYIFGKISKIIILHQRVYLMCKIMITEAYSSHFHAFEVSDSGKMDIFSPYELLDYHSLGIYKKNDKDFITLRYHVPEITE